MQQAILQTQLELRRCITINYQLATDVLFCSYEWYMSDEKHLSCFVTSRHWLVDGHKCLIYGTVDDALKGARATGIAVQG